LEIENWKLDIKNRRRRVWRSWCLFSLLIMH